MPAHLRLMTEDDLPAVDILQTAAYSPQLHESPASFAAKRRFYPQGAWVALIDGRVVGYLFSHPWKYGEPAPLGTEISTTQAPDCYYLHDITVAKDQRGQGIAASFIAKGEALAAGLGYKNIAMISVQESQEIWAKFGYRPVRLQGRYQEKLSAYGPGAVYLVKSI